MTNHIHRAAPGLTTERAFCGPVSDRENPAAHGNICVIYKCNCGAERLENVNGRHVERGEWHGGERSPEPRDYSDSPAPSAWVVVARMPQADGVIHEVMVEREHVAEARRTLDWRGATADWLTCPVRIREVRP